MAPEPDVEADHHFEDLVPADAVPLAGGIEADGDNAQDEGNWNPIEWDRAVEELTWERLLGLDGSLVSLK